MSLITHTRHNDFHLLVLSAPAQYRNLPGLFDVPTGRSLNYKCMTPHANLQVVGYLAYYVVVLSIRFNVC